MFGKEGLSKKIAPEHDLFCNIWKDGIYQKTHGKMIFSVHMGRCYRCDVTLLTKKQRYPCPRKIHARVTSSASPKKNDIHPRKCGISAEIPHLLTP